MKFTAIVVFASLIASNVQAQSGFGSSDVTSGAGEAGADSFDLSGLTPDDQTPTGKFTTAAEVGPILQMTKGSWSAVREYDGKDLVYWSHIFSWRCGLIAAKYSINGEPLKELKMPDCHMKYKQPNSILNEEALMTFQSFELGSVESVRIDLLLDNLTVQSTTLLRENILIP